MIGPDLIASVVNLVQPSDPWVPFWTAAGGVLGGALGSGGTYLVTRRQILAAETQRSHEREMAREERTASWRAQAYERVFGVTYQIALWIDWARKASILGIDAAGPEQSFVEDATWSDMTAKLRTYGSPEVIREFGKLEGRSVRLQSLCADLVSRESPSSNGQGGNAGSGEVALIVKECGRLFERTVRINRIMLNELSTLSSPDRPLLAAVPPAGVSFENRRRSRERIKMVIGAL